MKLLWWSVSIILVFGAVLALELSHFGTFPALPSAVSQTSTLLLGGVAVQVEIVSDPATLEKGLGGRSSLQANHGMLFVFPSDGQYPFWMKDMKFSIDIIWLAGNGRVVFIAPNISPSTYPRAYGPSQLSRYVLEVPAGFVAQQGVKVDDFARLP